MTNSGQPVHGAAAATRPEARPVISASAAQRRRRRRRRCPTRSPRCSRRSRAGRCPTGPALPRQSRRRMRQLDEIARRVIARLGDEPMRQAVLDAAERLVREEIERIKRVQQRRASAALISRLRRFTSERDRGGCDARSGWSRDRAPMPANTDTMNGHARRSGPPASHHRSRKARARRPRSRSGRPAGKPTGVYRFDRTAAARRGLLDRHAAADRQRLAARRPRLLVHAHRRHRALPADARQGRVLSDGVGRQRPADRAPRAELLTACAAIRRCRTTRRSCRRTSRASTPISVSRPNFIELCARLTAEDEKAFEQLWRYLGLSVDWSMTYATIGRRAQRVSQLAFLRLLQRGIAYQLEAPTLWDVDFRTAVAQAELEDREQPGAYHRIRFATADGGARRDRHDAPRADPGVRRARRASRRRALSSRCSAPRSSRRCSACACRCKPHPLADPEKGTGIAMICTFGDITDVDLVARAGAAGPRDHPAERRAAAGDVGRAGLGVDAMPARAQAAYDQLAGPVGREGARADRRAAAGERRSDRRAAADHARR